MNALMAGILAILILFSGMDDVQADTESLSQAGISEEAVAAVDSASTAAAAGLTGRWRAAETAEEEELRRKAIDEVTQDLGRIKRGKARDRLLERTAPPPSLMIEVTGSKATIVFGDHRLELELGAEPVEIKGRESRSLVSAKMEGEKLIVVSQTDKGEQTASYWADEKSLSRKVTMTGDQLGGSLTYISTYTRTD
jgi:hypothetical protein